ncbi:GMC oxidoreductase [Flagellimonas flava]|uniref:GMC oxidoreductase n=1 Tax=Flagellimonas flava TaxID=570519 RepID=UPI003D652531
MSNLNLKSKEQNTYDAIVIGSGISGGWAAKELCEKGLKTLVLERGRNVEHIKDYVTAHSDPWNSEERFALSVAEKEQQHKQVNTGIDGTNKHFFVNDIENPYIEDEAFHWIRGYHVGGRSLTWGRHSYRLGDLDFEANAKEGIGVDWPIRYKDIEPWYDYVEKYIGVSGSNLGLKQLPDQQLMPPMELNCVEKHLQQSLAEHYGNRVLTTGRVAHVTQRHNGRGPCQFRNRCSRGCPFGAYFSSNAVTLPAAEKTNNMTLRPHSIVNSIIYDNDLGKATGVRVIDEQSGEMLEFYGKVIFCNASALGSTFILLNSTSERFPDGMGNDSGQLGHNLMDHHFMVGAKAKSEGFEDKYYKGRRPNGIYIPRYRNVDEKSKVDSFVRGYGYQGGAMRQGWGRGVNDKSFGTDFKESLFKPGPWEMFLVGFGEHLPDYDNHVYINTTKQDKYGQPVLGINCKFGSNEIAMRKQMEIDAVEMLDKAGMKDIKPFNQDPVPGLGIHEMGTARMGRDAKTSVLNGNNAIHAVPNVYVTDGACMTSSACQNPSLTYMALTARAANHAVEQLKKKNI